MAPIWNPRLVLGLRADDQTEWLCVGTNPSTESDARIRCDRAIRPSELGKVNRLLAAMSHQMPDQVDHNELLHLARACLCSGVPSSHRGAQEAAVIYQWTERMSAEASELRLHGSPSITDADLGLPQSPRPTRTTFTSISSPPLYAPKPKPARMAALQNQPRLVTDLTPPKRHSAPQFPTPVAMDRAPPPKAVNRADRTEVDCEKWETETVIPSPEPLSSLPFCFSPTTAKDIERWKRSNSTSSSQSPRSAHMSASPYSTPATTPNLTVHSPSSARDHTPRELPPSPPDSAVSTRAPMSLHTHVGPPHSATGVDLSPGDRIITTSLVIPAHNNPLFQVPLTSPLHIQKLEECSRLLGESRAENRLLVDHISALRSELSDLRREQASIQAGMVLLMWVIQAALCFPLVVMGWAEVLCEVVFSSKIPGHRGGSPTVAIEGQSPGRVNDKTLDLGVSERTSKARTAFSVEVEQGNES